MGTEKRERQKANRQIRLEELQRQQVRQKRKRTAAIWGGIGVLAVFAAFLIWFFNHDNSSNTVATSDTSIAPTTTEPPPGATTAPAATTTVPGVTTVPAPFAYGTGECANPDGSSPHTTTFAAAPKLCIDPSKTYTATIETNKGTLTATLDASTAPGTVNNFVTLARYHYFDATPCHRIIHAFVVQCGDPTGKGTGGPGYMIGDELPPAGAYKVGSLAMANSGSPGTGGSQFFIISGAQGAALPADYSLFGQVTDGVDTTLPALDAAAGPDPSGSDAGGTPTKEPITITKVTITES